MKHVLFVFIFLSFLAYPFITRAVGPYTDNNNGTVTDAGTDLIWQKDSDNVQREWDQALSYCNQLILAGYSDWRLPNIRELRSIVEDNLYNPALNSIFGGSVSSTYWSATTIWWNQPYYAYSVKFYDGGDGYPHKNIPSYARCVRGGLKPQANIVPILSSLLLTKRLSASSKLNENVIAIGNEDVANILSTNISSTDETELILSGELANSAEDGSVLYVLPGSDDRFPFGIVGRVASSSGNTDGTKNVVLEEVTYADVVKKASVDMDDIVLDASNFVGVIAPAAVEAASPMSSMQAASSSDGSVYSFRDGAIIVRQSADNKEEMLMYSSAENSAINAGTISLNIKLDLAKMGVDASEMSPVEGKSYIGFAITGALKNIKLTNEYDYSLWPPSLGPVKLRMDGDINFDVKFYGKGTAKFGYFSKAWNDISSESFKILGANGKLTGLSSKDKVGKYPLAGLVFSVPCPPNKPCIVTPGEARLPLALAYQGGVILWVYLNIEGGFSANGQLSFIQLNPAKLSLGIEKPRAGEFKKIQSIKSN